MNKKTKLSFLVQEAIVRDWDEHAGLEAIELVSATADTVRLKGWVEFVDDEGFSDEATAERDFGWREILFSKDFAKALWGTDWIIVGDNEVTPDFAFPEMSPYLWHLQQMIIAEDSIDYCYTRYLAMTSRSQKSHTQK